MLKDSLSTSWRVCQRVGRQRRPERDWARLAGSSQRGRRGTVDSIGASGRALEQLAESTLQGERRREDGPPRRREVKTGENLDMSKWQEGKGPRFLDQSENGEWIHY